MTWENNSKIIEQMIKGSTGELWGNKLEQTDHYKILKTMLEIVGNNDGILVDIGCGAGDVSRSWNGSYIGIDLDWIISGVAKKCNPNNEYISLDVVKDEVKLSGPVKCVLMNAFLEMFPDPLSIIKKICCSIDADWIIIHRQKLGNITHSTTNKSYANVDICCSMISFMDLEAFEQQMSIKEISIVNWTGDYYTFLMRMK
jgi:hypothetical protein